jgi:hypothetical protein
MRINLQDEKITFGMQIIWSFSLAIIMKHLLGIKDFLIEEKKSSLQVALQLPAMSCGVPLDVGDVRIQLSSYTGVQVKVESFH